MFSVIYTLDFKVFLQTNGFTFSFVVNLQKINYECLKEL